jgi:hypothetical protein
MDADEHRPRPARGAAAVTEQLLASGAFVEVVFHCPDCGLGGTSVARPSGLRDRECVRCGSDVVVTVLDRFGRR